MSASCLCLRPPELIPVSAICLFSWSFVTLSWGATITLSFLLLAEEDFFGHAYAEARWTLCRAGRLSLGLLRLPFDAKDGAQAALMKPLK